MGQVVQGIAILVDKIGLGLSKLIQVGPNLARFVQLRQGGFKLVRVWDWARFFQISQVLRFFFPLPRFNCDFS